MPCSVPSSGFTRSMSSGRMTTSTGWFVPNPGAENLNDPVFHHDTVDDIAVPDKIGYERVDRLIVDHFRCADLLDVALVHDDDGVGHGEGFLLVVRNEDKGDAELVFQADQLILHFLAEL